MATYVIVGGVAGGASAAARLRRMDEAAHIVVLERGKYVSFANCGLPYHIGGVIQERDALLVSTPEKLQGEFAIDVRTEQEVVRVDRAAKEVVVRDLRSPDADAYRLAYDKLILSPGAKPLTPPIPGVDLEGVYALRDIPDMDRIKSRLDRGGVQRAVVVGGGFIGLEMAENLLHRGVQVTLVEMLNQVMAPIDHDMAALLHRHLRDKGVRLALGDGLQRIEQTGGGGLRAMLASGKSAYADLIVLAIGVRPESDLAKEAGLELGPRGHIVVDAHMQSSDPDIYAVGDAVQAICPVLGAPAAIPLAGPANRQARIAADHITGKDVAYQGTLGTSIVKVFDLVAAVTGVNSRALTSQGIPFRSSITHSQHHVSYYPGATQQSTKLLYSPDDGRLLGAQVVGRDAVDRTINVLATAIKAGMTVYDLEHLELAYAPPYGAAKDPVNIAGYVASNSLRGDTQLISYNELIALEPGTYGVLDVRTDPEWEIGHIPGAVHIENSRLRTRMGELSKDKMWVTCCKMGRRAYVMERMLKQHGYQVATLSGGWDTYEALVEPQSNFEGDDEYEQRDLEQWKGHGSNGSDPTQGEPVMRVADNGSTATAQIEAAATIVAAPPVQPEPVAQLDARGLQCPGPIMAVYKRMQEMRDGEVLKVLATDPGFRRDIAAWAERTGNELLALQDGPTIEATLRKRVSSAETLVSEAQTSSNTKTMVVFSGDLDRALASFIIANGAASMGQQVTMFFTFWGLNILRRPEGQAGHKNLVERAFGWMLPKGADKLKLSKLNMGGLGTAMMKAVMKAKRVDSLPELMRMAQDNGVRFIACQMSMDIMGIKAEELIDGVKVGGVATFINEADRGNASLFI